MHPYRGDTARHAPETAAPSTVPTPETALQRLERLYTAFRETHGVRPTRIVMTPEAVTEYMRSFGPGVRQVFSLDGQPLSPAFAGVPIVEELGVVGGVRVE